MRNRILNFIFLITILMLVLLPVKSLQAQDPGREYFEKVPTRFYKPGLSAAQSFHFSRMGMAANEWVNHPLELRTDVAEIHLSRRAGIVFGAGAFMGLDYQQRELYKVQEQTAKEKTTMYFFAPTLSTGVAYGFFFPYYISARGGFYYGWEIARYKANIPLQYSGSDAIETKDISIAYSRTINTGLRPYITFELYRPWHSRSAKKHPFGWSVAYTILPRSGDPDTGKSGTTGAFNIGLYWHKAYKNKK